MNITLLSINAKYIHSSLSVWLLMQAVGENSSLSHNCRVIESTIHKDDDELLAEIKATNPQVLGISAYIWNAALLQNLIPWLKSELDCVVVLGGPEASFNAEFWLKKSVDYVVCGEGEVSFPKLVDAIAASRGFEDIGGLCYIDDGKCVKNEIAAADFVPPNPYTDEYLASVKGKLAYIETSRGCPFSCEFCLSGGARLRDFPIAAAKEQIRWLLKTNAHTIKFVDRTFNANIARAYELFEFVIGLECDCCFHFEVAADLFDDATIDLLATAKAGRIQLEIGLQSFCKDTLASVMRRCDIEKAERNIAAILSKKNIHTHVDLIAGLPHEGLGQFALGFDRAFYLGAHTLQLGFLKLLHGSRLREKASDYKIKFDKAAPYEVESTAWLTASELDILRETENALQRMYNSGKFLGTIEYILDVTKLSPFALFSWIGAAIPNHGMEFSDYTYLVYEYCATLGGVDPDRLRDNMAVDLLASIKGKNMPDNLKVADKRLKELAAIASHNLGRTIGRCEITTLLTENVGIVVDSEQQDPVTGLYKIYTIEM